MLKIKLTRIGKKHEPHYRIIVIPERAKREGKAVEQLGYYNPRTKELTLKSERIQYWLSVGAQPTHTVHDLLARQKLIKPRKRVKVEAKKKKEDDGKENSAEGKKAPTAEVKTEQKAEEPKEKKEDKETQKSENSEPEKKE